MSKTKIISHHSEENIMGEKNILSKINHPFIVNMYFSFQDNDNLYLLLDLLSGGDLRYHLSNKKPNVFNEIQTKFFISNIILALEYIHSQKIIHRDIKPENLVLDISGYVRLTDFGIAIINKNDHSKESSGTAGYMAPEVILQQGHSYPADFFALGVIGYEFMIGNRPYHGENRKQIKNSILSYQAKIKFNNTKKGWTENSKDFINRLLQRRPAKRLGYNGIKEIKNHSWQIQPCSALRGEGLIEGLKWLSEQLVFRGKNDFPNNPYENNENEEKEDDKKINKTNMINSENSESKINVISEMDNNTNININAEQHKENVNEVENSENNINNEIL